MHHQVAYISSILLQPLQTSIIFHWLPHLQRLLRGDSSRQPLTNSWTGLAPAEGSLNAPIRKKHFPQPEWDWLNTVGTTGIWEALSQSLPSNPESSGSVNGWWAAGAGSACCTAAGCCGCLQCLAPCTSNCGVIVLFHLPSFSHPCEFYVFLLGKCSGLRLWETAVRRWLLWSLPEEKVGIAVPAAVGYLVVVVLNFSKNNCTVLATSTPCCASISPALRWSLFRK